MSATLVRLRVRGIQGLWGFRGEVTIAVKGRSFTAAYDAMDNCLGGSCKEVEELLNMLGDCRLVVERRPEPLATVYALEESVERVYECPDELVEKALKRASAPV